MTVRELSELLEAADPDMMVVCYAGNMFFSPCPAETGVIEMGPELPYVDEHGELITPEDREEPLKMLGLFPHDPNNPHD